MLPFLGMLSINQIFLIFMAFFAVMNPLANTPIFLSITANETSDFRKKVAIQSVVISFFITTLFCILGQQIFSVFGITMHAFKITGGLLIVSIGFEMLHGNTSTVQSPSLHAHMKDKDRILSMAVSPLSIPLLSGPGTITTAVNFGSTGNITDLISTIVAFGFLGAITVLAFISGEQLQRFLGQSGFNVITRLMGLILGVVGVQMLITGLRGAFPLLTAS